MTMKLLSPILLMGLVACGTEEEQIVKRFAYDIKDKQLELAVEFNNEAELNTELSIPILNYGSVLLSPSSQSSGFIIGAKLNLDVINDERIVKLEKTRNLPNGEPMSNYVVEDVARIHVKASEPVSTSIYLGTNMEHAYVGVAVELNFLDKNFPSGLVISQRIRDDQNRLLGVVTLFGPKVVNEQVVAPGGLFVMTNVTDLIALGGTPQTLSDETVTSHDGIVLPDSNPEINQAKYKNPQNRYELFKLYRRQGLKAGMIDP